MSQIPQDLLFKAVNAAVWVLPKTPEVVQLQDVPWHCTSVYAGVIARIAIAQSCPCAQWRAQHWRMKREGQAAADWPTNIYRSLCYEAWKTCHKSVGIGTFLAKTGWSGCLGGRKVIQWCRKESPPQPRRAVTEAGGIARWRPVPPAQTAWLGRSAWTPCLHSNVAAFNSHETISTSLLV